MAFKIEAAQRMLVARNEEEAGKLFIVLKQAFGEPTDKAEYKHGTVYQNVSWHLKTIELQLVLAKNDRIVLDFGWKTPAGGSYGTTAEGSTASNVLNNLQTYIRGLLNKPENLPKGAANNSALKKLLSLKV